MKEVQGKLDVEKKWRESVRKGEEILGNVELIGGIQSIIEKNEELQKIIEGKNGENQSEKQEFAHKI